jgi:hypothetical protein
MKNLKLIYLIPAMMLLVWGCSEQGAKESTDMEIVESRDSLDKDVNALNYCSTKIDSTVAKTLYNTPGDFSKSYPISGMSPLVIDSMTANVPILYSEIDSCVWNDTTRICLDFSLMFRLKNLTLSSGYSQVKYIRSSNVLVIQLDAINATTNNSYHKISGNIKDFYPAYDGTGIERVVAIIRRPKGAGTAPYDYSFCTNVLDLCKPYSLNSTPSTSFVLSANSYNHSIVNDGAPHIYSQSNKLKTNIEYIDLEIPVGRGFIINPNRYSCIATNNGTESKLTISINIDPDSTQPNSLIYSFNGHINSLFSNLTNVEEIEVIITNSNTNKTKKVKVRVQSSNNHGIVNIQQPADSTGRQ